MNPISPETNRALMAQRYDWADEGDVPFTKQKFAIIAVDPGATCGIAIYCDGRFDSLQLPRRDAVVWIRGAVDGMEAQGVQAVLVVERFTTGTSRRRAVTRQPEAEEVAGALYDLSTERLLDLYRQSPADAKAFCLDDWLRRVEWYRPGQPHANDAARHLKLCLAKHFIGEFTRVHRGETVEMNRIEEPEELRNRAAGVTPS